MAMPAENALHNVDCLAGLAEMRAGSVDLAFADPPFNIGYRYDVYDDRQEDERYLDWSRQWMAGVRRTLKPTGAFWLAIGDEYAAELKLIAEDLGLTCQNWVLWYYTFGVNCTRKFTRSHAHLSHFVVNPRKFTFHLPDGPESRLPRRAALTHDGWVLRPQDMPTAFTAREDVWCFARVAGTFAQRAGWHGCQMPEHLLARIIRATSNPGELVLDPFGGSGTTLATAKKLDRRFIGFELSREYAKRIDQRLAAIKPGDALEGFESASSAPATGKGRKVADLSKMPRPIADVAAVKPVEVPAGSVTRGAAQLAVVDVSARPAEALPAADEWLPAVERALDPTGACWIAAGDEQAAQLKVASERLGFTCRSWVVWYSTVGLGSRGFRRSHVHLFHLVKDAEQFTFRDDDLANRIPSARQLVYGDLRANPTGRLPDDTWVLPPDSLPADLAADDASVELPAKVLARIIRTCSAEGSLVIDPFAGPSRALAVARRLNREIGSLGLTRDGMAGSPRRSGSRRKPAMAVGRRS
jgi:site-specific DNA-methyltransferase (adenine-specific)